jgi:hypothetical protein
MTQIARWLAPLLLGAAMPLAAAPATAHSLPVSLSVPLHTATTAQLPREAVTASAQDKTLHCEGAPLVAWMRHTGAMSTDPLLGAQLARRVEVAARRVELALAELDPSLGNTHAVLVDCCDGQPLGAQDGPLRLLVPGDSRPARWIRQSDSITVVGMP